MKICVGAGPDFILKMEQMDFFHKVSCSIIFADHLVRDARIFSDRSLLTVSKMVKRFLEFKQVEISRPNLIHQDLSFSIQTPTVSVSLALPKGLVSDDRTLLQNNFLLYLALI
jgi:hypothetical protein